MDSHLMMLYDLHRVLSLNDALKDIVSHTLNDWEEVIVAYQSTPTVVWIDWGSPRKPVRII
jgi:hypothetical protein